ncbi:MAG: guanylate kinase [bacterium (Candidatus Stahlbacteria) CG08_land_8_20_14_0_20_40_26]|nr:MAG: guanylate kinase [bacterium (Candidatus Stahlbacteria) CG23_combo_of_CG06-09_8_20_14_all_40_9]PIS26601.1 MAG: guanylate kinase [bacterium (Candidatus Stahlbacteria) CG08_land_8_20_14_0_20_40_26]
MYYEPFFLVLVGPSGVGKSTIVREIIKLHKDIKYSISATTRRPRKDEVNGKDYYFLDIPTFKNWIKEDKLYEWALVYGDYYGTPREHVDAFIRESHDVIFDLDIQGAISVKSQREDTVTVFLLPPSKEELKRRLLKRGDNENAVVERIKEIEREVKTASRFDYIIRNDVLEETIKKVDAIIIAERHRTKRIRLS